MPTFREVAHAISQVVSEHEEYGKHYVRTELPEGRITRSVIHFEPKTPHKAILAAEKYIKEVLKRNDLTVSTPREGPRRFTPGILVMSSLAQRKIFVHEIEK